LSLTTGVRWQNERKTASINNSLTAPGASFISTTLTPPVSPGGEPVNGAINRETDALDWSVTPQFKLSNHSMAYFTLAHTSKSGGFNTGFGNAPLSAREFKDESIEHYELGAKWTLADERIRLSAATFITQYQDYQDAAFVSAQFTVGNAEQVDLSGFELEGEVLLSNQLAADFSISYADLKYETNSTGMCYPGRMPDGSLPRSCDLSGERPINAPEWRTHAGLHYALPVRWGELLARVDWSWTDRYNTSFSADPRLIQDAYSEIGVRLSARIGESYEVIGWVENMLDAQVTYVDAVLNLFNDASYQSFMAVPRSYGVTMRVRF
jgi:iron complex outermembrane receptor protein